MSPQGWAVGPLYLQPQDLLDTTYRCFDFLLLGCLTSFSIASQTTIKHRTIISLILILLLHCSLITPSSYSSLWINHGSINCISDVEGILYARPNGGFLEQQHRCCSSGFLEPSVYRSISFCRCHSILGLLRHRVQ